MKNMIKQVSSSLAPLAIVSLVWLGGCRASDDDFSDIGWLEQAIRKDVDEVYGIQIVNDTGPQDIDTTQVSTVGFTAFGKTYVMTMNRNPNATLRVGRKIEKFYRKNYYNLIDTLATVLVKDSLVGIYWSIRGSGPEHPDTIITKDLRHVFLRTVNFVKREDVERYGGWVRTGVSPSFGVSVGTTLRLDSLVIVTPRDTIITDSPRDLVFQNGHMLRLREGDEVDVHVRAYDFRPERKEALFGLVFPARNRDGGPDRPRYYLRPVGLGMYHNRFVVGAYPDSSKIHHLVVDFVDRSTITRIDPELFPYNSFMVVVPFVVVRP